MLLISQLDRNALSKVLLVDHSDKLCNRFVLTALNEPLTEVALNRHVQHLLLLWRQLRSLNLLLNLFEMLCSNHQNVDVLLRAEEELLVGKLLWEA